MPPVDECKQGLLNDCHIHAMCIDTVEGYTCECMPGYFGDGKETCAGTFVQCDFFRTKYYLGKIWNGNTTIATLISTGAINDNHPLENMFDGDLNTYWHSQSISRDHITLTITFNEMISFQGVRIIPRDSNQLLYQNLCIYLDKTRVHSGAEEICTDETFVIKEYEKFTLSASRQKQTNEIFIRFPESQYTYISELEIIYSGKV